MRPVSDHPSSVRHFAGMIILSRVVSKVHDQPNYDIIDNLRKELAEEFIGHNTLSKAYYGVILSSILAELATKLVNQLFSEDSE